MTRHEAILEYIGEDELARINRWLDYCDKHITYKTKQEAWKKALLLLDKSSISKFTFWVIVMCYVFQFRYVHGSFPTMYQMVDAQTVPWHSISNNLTRYCGLAFSWDEGWLRIWEQDKYWCPLPEGWIYCDGKMN